MVQLAATRQIHRAVLSAGDSDFLPAIDAIKSHGVLTVLFHGPPGQYHQELWDGCDERVEMSAAMIERIKR